MVTQERIDGGRPFDWGRASEDYAKYRDGLGWSRVLPRNLYRYGARFVGADIYEAQIAQARKLSAEEGFDLNIEFTRESWHGRIRACRGIGASSLSQGEISAFEKEHAAYLGGVPEKFDILHYASVLVLRKI